MTNKAMNHNNNTTEPRLLRYDISDNITAFTTTRKGGYSFGNYASFNANHYCGDNPESVEKNRQLLAKALGITTQQLIIPHQTHSTNVLHIDSGILSELNKQHSESLKQYDNKENTQVPTPEQLEGVDATITNIPGICLCISTADCIPILLYDEKNKAAAAIHAGWRGTLGRIAEATLDLMKKAFGTEGQDCKAVIGPGISLDSFEVGNEVFDAFMAEGFNMELIARKYPCNDDRKEAWHIDLWEANKQQLLSKGLLPENIHLAGICTYKQCDEFFSARRLGIKSGRLLTGIIIRE